MTSSRQLALLLALFAHTSINHLIVAQHTAHASYPPHQPQYGMQYHAPPPPPHPHQPCCLTKDATAAPILNTLLFFDKCPAHLDGETICQAVASAIAKPETDLYPVESANITLSGDGQRVHANQQRFHITGYYDLAVVQNGYCFNIYPNVKYGDELDASCSNTLAADPISIVDYSSIWVAGDFYYTISNAISALSLHLPARVGANWSGQPPARINQDLVVGGCFPTFPLVVGGDIGPSGSGAITVNPTTSASTALGGIDYDTRLGSQEYKELSESEVAQTVFEMSEKACALSKRVQSFKQNGDVLFSVQNAEITVFLTCPGGDPVCVVTLDRPLLNLPTESVIFDINYSAAEVIKINVPGAAQSAAVDFADTAFQKPIIWNFYEADTIDILVLGAAWLGSVLAPRARKVTFTYDANISNNYGAFVLGHPKSHLSLLNANTFRPGGGYCPPATPDVTLCNCLCRHEKKHFGPPIHKALPYHH